MSAKTKNEKKKKHPGGRPPKFKTVDQLQSIIDAYFDSCYKDMPLRDKDGNVVLDSAGKPYIERQQIEPITITGLALALDTTRETLMDIEDANGPYTIEFSDAITRAKLRCQNYAEKQMFTAKSPNGPIFALKNYGWKDKTEIDSNVKGDITISLEGDAADWSK